MNMQISAADFIPATKAAQGYREPQPHLSEIQRWVALRAEIERLQQNFWPMPDAAMDFLGEAQSKVEQAIIVAAPSSVKDIAEKFRLAALLIEESEEGMMYVEPEIVFGAVKDLSTYRCAEWAETYSGVSDPNPYYSHVLMPVAVTQPD